MAEDRRELEITPEPSDEERVAIAAAVNAGRARRSPGALAWWDAGVRENVGDADGRESDTGGAD